MLRTSAVKTAVPNHNLIIHTNMINKFLFLAFLALSPLTAFPNPSKTSQEVTLRWEGELEQQATLECTDMMGKVIHRQTLRKGTWTSSVQTTDWAPGVYQVTLRQVGEKPQNTKIVVVGE